MNNTDFEPPQIVQQALDQVLILESEIPSLKTFGEKAQTDLKGLECSVELNDRDGLREVAHLQTLVALYPRRLSAREDELAEAKKNLLKTCHDFIKRHLSPRCDDLGNKAKEILAKELSPHFKEKWQLDNAVANSAVFSEIVSLKHFATIREPSPEQTKLYARDLMQAWARANEFEKTHLN